MLLTVSNATDIYSDYERAVLTHTLQDFNSKYAGNFIDGEGICINVDHAEIGDTVVVQVGGHIFKVVLILHENTKIKVGDRVSFTGRVFLGTYHMGLLINIEG
jgi:hypothetical protein